MTGAAEERVVAGRYRLSTCLGRGGMGTVWDGWDAVLRRPVAVKEVLPPPGLPGAEREELVERTRREARAAAAVASPAVMTVYDVVEEGDRTWIVMERLPPRTLADVIAEEGPLPPARAATIGLALLEALDAAHAAGVLHRDVKPANVLWGPGGRVVLADFGIAQAVGEASITRTGMVLGSPAYLAPERARGAAAGPASDLWGLGATLYAAVEGRSPFDRGEALPTLTAVVTEDVPAAPHSGALGPVLDGLLHKDPAGRMGSEQARRLLQRAARSGEERAVPVAVPAPPGRSSATQALPLERVAAAGAAGAGGAPEPTGARRSRAVPDARAAVAVAAAVALAYAAPFGSGDPGGEPTASGPGTASVQPSTAGTDSPAPQEPEVTSEPTSEVTPQPTSEVTPQPTSEATSASTSEPAAAGGSSPASPQGPSAAPEPPAGFERYTDASGFSIAVPAGWQVEHRGHRVYLRDPGSSRYLLVDQTDEPKPDPLLDWQQQEPALAQRFDGYERVRLERVQVDYAQEAADVEFRHGPGGRTHVLNRNLLIGPDRAYALYWSAPDATWPQQRELFDTVAATFRLAG